MIKDIVIAILSGIAIAQRITQPGDPARVAVILVIAVMAFMALLELEDLWDKHHQIMQRTLTITSAVSKATCRILKDISSRMRWYKIRLRTYPVELVQQHQRRQVLIEYIDRLRAMGEVKRDDVRCM